MNNSGTEMKKIILIAAFTFCLISLNAYSQTPLRWPISNNGAPNADLMTSLFGPRTVNSKYQIHYGMDLADPTGFPNQNVYNPSEYVYIGHIYEDLYTPSNGWIIVFDIINEFKDGGTDVNGNTLPAEETLLFYHSDVRQKFYSRISFQ